MNLILLATTAYLLGGFVTYGVLIDNPEEFDNSTAGHAVRASHPHASERQIESTLRHAHHRMSILLAGAWPLLAAVLIMAIPVAIRRNTRTRK